MKKGLTAAQSQDDGQDSYIANQLREELGDEDEVFAACGEAPRLEEDGRLGGTFGYVTGVDILQK